MADLAGLAFHCSVKADFAILRSSDVRFESVCSHGRSYLTAVSPYVYNTPDCIDLTDAGPQFLLSDTRVEMDKLLKSHCNYSRFSVVCEQSEF